MLKSDQTGGDILVRRPEGCYSIRQADGIPLLDERQFNPSGYAHAEPIVGKGGRGSAWFVEFAGIPAVLKHYRRGGMAAKLSDSWYFGWRDADSRSFREMNMLCCLRTGGLSVPRPLAAFRLGRLGFYRAAILTERIVGARSLVEAVNSGNAPWSAIGRALARFHADHARHADLNANNILIDPSDKVFVIDWDKGRIDAGNTRWHGRVIDRLVRSLHKECGSIGAGELERGIETLRRAYQWQSA